VRALLCEGERADDLIAVSRQHVSAEGIGLWAQVDMCDRHALRELLQGALPEVVINCAGATHGDIHCLTRENIVAVESLLDAMKDNTQIRLVHVGSVAEYGPVPDRRCAVEGTAENPGTTYGASKLAATQLVLNDAVLNGRSSTILRVANPVGRGQPARTVLGNAVRQIVDCVSGISDRLTLGPLNSYRDFVALHDVARSIAFAVDRPPERGAIVNIGSGTATSVREMVNTLATIAECRGTVIEGGGGSVRSSEVDWQCADVSRARKLLDWQPTISNCGMLTVLWNEFRHGTPSMIEARG
jgi:nucleoside-diphosphate-sugar epimerase